jgi:hypothetical protein
VGKKLVVGKVTVAEFAEPIDGIDPANVHVDGYPKMLGKHNFPKAVHEADHMIYYEGRYYACGSDADVNVVEGWRVSRFRSDLANLKCWKFAMMASGPPLGFDNRCVYTLDEHLCPKERIINLNKDEYPTEWWVHASLASDGNTLCFVTISVPNIRMQIWSLDGRTKFSETAVRLNHIKSRNSFRKAEDSRIAVLGGGYLFCGAELTWLSAKGESMRFVGAKPKQDIASRSQFGHPAHLNTFTPPAMADGKVFVGHESGNIYIFDTASFRGTAGDRETADTTP